jgi:hypothetical protein
MNEPENDAWIESGATETFNEPTPEAPAEAHVEVAAETSVTDVAAETTADAAPSAEHAEQVAAQAESYWEASFEDLPLRAHTLDTDLGDRAFAEAIEEGERRRHTLEALDRTSEVLEHTSKEIHAQSKQDGFPQQQEGSPDPVTAGLLAGAIGVSAAARRIFRK